MAIALEFPVMEEVAMSVAVIVWFPTVSIVALKVPAPPGSCEFVGRIALPSLLVKRTVPA
jgi:hypothetical protein